MDEADRAECFTDKNITYLHYCYALFSQISTSGWTTDYSLGCQEVDYSVNEQAVRMAGWVWWTMCLKMVELVETVFFVLRKKYNQVSPLHVYHHISTLSIAWLCVKYIAGNFTYFMFHVIFLQRIIV